MITEAAVSFEPTIAPVYHGSAALVCWPTGCPLLQRRALGASRMANAKTLVELQYVLQHHFDRAEAAHQRAARPSVMGRWRLRCAISTGVPRSLLRAWTLPGHMPSLAALSWHEATFEAYFPLRRDTKK